MKQYIIKNYFCVPRVPGGGPAATGGGEGGAVLRPLHGVSVRRRGAHLQEGNQKKKHRKKSKNNNTDQNLGS